MFFFYGGQSVLIRLNQNITSSVETIIDKTSIVLLIRNGFSEFVSPSLQSGRKDARLTMLNGQSDVFSVLIMPSIIALGVELKEQDCVP